MIIPVFMTLSWKTNSFYQGINTGKFQFSIDGENVNIPEAG